MAKSRPVPEKITPPSVTPETGKRLLVGLLERGRQMLTTGIAVDRARFETWTNLCSDSLTKTFGSDSDYLDQFWRAGRRMQVIMSGYHDEQYFDQLRSEELQSKVATIESFVDAIDFTISNSAEITPSLDMHQKAPTKTREVFVVHGHDENAKIKVARFLERLDLIHIILHEKPDQGLTIIEKLEKHATGASFAVVLLTPDDVGASKASSGSLNPRSRQNVLLEMGYFIGKLGRAHVCPLYVADVELPSDLLGVIYTPLDDSGSWELKLAKEMRAAGITIDLNKL